jgi:filamentous hemagglutinin family protein
VSYLRTNNFIEDSKLALSSNRLSEAQFGINHGRRIGGVRQPRPGHAGRHRRVRRPGQPQPGPGQADARYRKYTATVSYLQPFKLWGESFSFSSLMTGQRSEDVLFSPQRISLGGQSSIRGYKDQSLSGDSGGYWRNDLRWSRPVTWAWMQPVFSEYGTSLGYDQGVIRHGRYNGEQHGRMSSNSLELFARGQNVAASVTFAHSWNARGRSPSVKRRSISAWIFSPFGHRDMTWTFANSPFLRASLLRLEKPFHLPGLAQTRVGAGAGQRMFWQPLLAQADGIVVSAGHHARSGGQRRAYRQHRSAQWQRAVHNQFSDYNVGQQGVILNNATSRTQSTQLGGIILGNQNLNGTAASVILNEVNGGSPSQLRGYTEVAGQSAHVIVANPYGITCNGCGFINTRRRR